MHQVQEVLLLWSYYLPTCSCTIYTVNGLRLRHFIFCQHDKLTIPDGYFLLFYLLLVGISLVNTRINNIILLFSVNFSAQFKSSLLSAKRTCHIQIPQAPLCDQGRTGVDSTCSRQIVVTDLKPHLLEEHPRSASQQPCPTFSSIFQALTVYAVPAILMHIMWMRIAGTAWNDSTCAVWRTYIHC